MRFRPLARGRSRRGAGGRSVDVSAHGEVDEDKDIELDEDGEAQEDGVQDEAGQPQLPIKSPFV